MSKSKGTKRLVWDLYQAKGQETDDDLGLSLFIPSSVATPAMG